MTVEVISNRVIKVKVASGAINAAAVPSGGLTGQVLAKNSSTNYDLEWITPSAGGGGGEVSASFDYGDATPKPLFTIPADKVIYSVTISMLVAFDDAAATLSVGYSGQPQALLATTDVAPNTLGGYETRPNVTLGSDTELTLSISPGTSTVGSGLVTVLYQS